MGRSFAEDAWLVRSGAWQAPSLAAKELGVWVPEPPAHLHDHAPRIAAEASRLPAAGHGHGGEPGGVEEAHGTPVSGQANVGVGSAARAVRKVSVGAEDPDEREGSMKSSQRDGRGPRERQGGGGILADLM